MEKNMVVFFTRMVSNPDKSKQNQPIIGLIILEDFSFNSDEWKDGTMYDAESGKTYNCNISLKDKSNLRVRCYIGISLFGRTERRTRTSL
jgi:uncharacterized protein (DUF2147 family)